MFVCNQCGKEFALNPDQCDNFGIFFIRNYHLDIIQGFVNPEYGAIKDIVDFIK